MPVSWHAMLQRLGYWSGGDAETGFTAAGSGAFFGAGSFFGEGEYPCVAARLKQAAKDPIMVKFIGDYNRLINLDHVRKLEIRSRSGGTRLDVTWTDGKREKFRRLSEEFAESIEHLLRDQVAQRTQGGNEAHHRAENAKIPAAEAITSGEPAAEEVNFKGRNEAHHHVEKTEASVAEAIASEDPATDEVKVSE